MAYQNLISEIKENILYITINREKALNALNKDTLAELADVIAFAGKTDEVRGVILTGAGEKAFVAGADIKEFSDYSGKQGEDLAKRGHDLVFNAIENSSKPFIAAINGFALGGGLELAMACHIRIASDHAKLGLPEVTLGLIPGYGGTQRLTQLVGKGKAIEMITTANMITASDAEKIGLVNYVVPQPDLISKAEEILNVIKQRAPLAISAAIKSVIAAVNNNNGYATEIEEFGKCFETADFKEGVTAFIEKRKANFTGK
ncbi:enoyl-CoA hydratase/isomerase family protein [Pedobacter riviphilus]|uniref:Enoyl-CoA hydratase/isomerase family protein n=1 Tax=Pedobacter riviphilus TaxID=2766984 RepID=A0ABX6TEV9_9SPHI|nr:MULTISPECIES: enoyl-CoA hydratase-related protein [Pedobacter]NII84194.1 enoyl-CoA hydratase [Pedobacter sp. SG908]NMN38890.1 enoyl-CoA hydratase [Pedobacter sp. SG918]QNR84044.1 enoyl-CoA hydratase/isomerase family protein [Pedobacter riviphilus]